MIRRLSYLSGIAAVFVVLNHALGWGFTAMIWWPHKFRPVLSPNFDQVHSQSYFLLRMLEQMVVVAVPAFLFVSGFFVVLALNRSSKQPVADVIWRRIRILAMPFIIWSAIMLTLEVIQTRSFQLLEILRALLLGTAVPGFYFIPLLIQLYLLSPLILRWGRQSWRSLLAASGLSMMLVALLRYGFILGVDMPGKDILSILIAGWFFPGSLFWFGLGIVAGIDQNRFRSTAQKGALLWSISAVGLIILGVLEWELLFHFSGKEWIGPTFTMLDMLYSLAFLISFMTISDRVLIFQKHISRLGGKAYGIYLAHSIVLILFARGIYHMAPSLLAFTIVFVVMLTTAGVGFPVLMMEIVKVSPLRRGYAYLFG
jgi:peptidoglycan/LPS O-acetylase OafA/YrhL